MSQATNITSGGLVSFSVTAGGAPVPDTVRILSVRVEKRVNRVASARIIILDGEADTGTFDVSSSATFVPGAVIAVQAGYDNAEQVIFQGIVTGQRIVINDLVGSTLEIECRDQAIKMTAGRKCLTFSQQADSDIITSIIGTYDGLSADVTSTSTQWPEQIQYYTTDWDFMLARAEANGLIVTTINNKVTVAQPDAGTSPVLTIAYGNNLLEFDADLNALTQLPGVNATSWDYKNQAVGTSSAQNQIPGPGNLSSSDLAGMVGINQYQLQTTAPLETTDLNGWCNAQVIKGEYAKIQGRVLYQGSALADIANYITLQGVGDRFTGNHFVSGITHDLSDGNWTTEASLGLSPAWFTEEPDVMAPPASGLLPGARGLLNGTVKQINDDPDNQYRILVNIPLFDQNGAGIWARLSNFYSTSNAGAFFLPEVGDEVVLGFLNEDPRYPVILGSMYSSASLKPYNTLQPNQNNTLKSIVSKSGLYVQFDDENVVLTINTPDKNTMIFSDKDKQIIIQDENNNSIVMSADGITIKSEKNINIQADQKVSITGSQGITLTADGGDVEISGINIKETADSQYSAMGSETAQINSGMELTLKSAMIMIN
ncbi:type VI secretion system tip protein VgrG [Mucilaginibacter sp. 14171R-50]|uniref:type VI secretion system tip protein VgrG n=1 Tax=Mucilaginibacter sp. 14171R-50 TaxID=2703789 RepID=UPI00138C00BB|nr:type VI secretion system tip protein VgrG [Mucilaginibacter sp. 14171R-50]QHS56449.1 type VI secretion system tip protein VgrG [Mucilaginibacter sp. 14171R-50]